MTVSDNKKSNKITPVILTLILLISGITLVLFIEFRPAKKQNTVPLTDEQNQANISIGKVYQTATRQGIKEWTLNAQSAKIINAKNQAIFQDLSVTFFLKNNTKVHLTSDQGILNTVSNDIEVFGHVVVQNKNYRLETESLHYKHKERVLFSEIPVNITSRTSQITADSMTYDLDANKAVLKGHIKGIFGDKVIS